MAINQILIVLHILLWRTLAPTTHAMPPPDPIQCDRAGCTLNNSYGAWPDREPCRASAAAYPATEDELRSAVAYAVRNGLRAKSVSGFSHTIPRFACPSSMNGPAGSLLISTARLVSVDVDAGGPTATAGAGVGLRALVDRLAEEGLSLAAGPYWEGASAGGAAATGAHGSSWWGRGGALHDHVVGVRLVAAAGGEEGYARVLDLRAGDPLFEAARLSLGTLGVVSKVTFVLERGFKRSIMYNFTNDDGIENEFMEHAKKHEFGDIQWYPSRRIAVYRYDNRLPLNESGDGVNDFIGFQSNPAIATQTIRALEKAAEKTRDAKAKCLLATSFVAYKKLTANGLKNNKLIFTGYPVIGHQAQMQTSGSCLYSSETIKSAICPWDPRINGLFFFESTAIFQPSKFANFIRDVRKLRDLNSDAFCGLDMYNGILIRFVKKSTAYLGQDEDSVAVDFNYFRADRKSTPRLYQDIYEEIEQMAFFKYGAKPHWAKNRNVAFIDVRRKYAGFEKFLKAKKILDPKNVFSGGWSDEILFGENGFLESGDGCALEGELGRGNLHWVKLWEVLEDDEEDDSGSCCGGRGGGGGAWGRGGWVELVGLSTVWVH
ncbi:L-gulonolactone oxidase 3 [Striga hermonthica]|uniref:L-gulonolactone oxidase n=1 Tax=Striga hermonthica TaxID=68872 RepID=A0A9N7RMW0_STRHE|nr:L-gulonolactone oxidase 3 [Striga hermonthica]